MLFNDQQHIPVETRYNQPKIQEMGYDRHTDQPFERPVINLLHSYYYEESNLIFNSN